MKASDLEDIERRLGEPVMTIMVCGTHTIPYNRVYQRNEWEKALAHINSGYCYSKEAVFYSATKMLKYSVLCEVINRNPPAQE